MADTKKFPYERLSTSDLVLDGVYEGGAANNYSTTPLPELLGVGTAGGFRPLRFSDGSDRFSYVILFTTFNEPDWPDYIDAETGRFTYYGDNRSPGSTIHEKNGNKILREIFHKLHQGERETIPPFFVFSREEGWDRKFRGLAVPGDRLENQSEDLVAIWKHKDGDRFQNYRATFTILDVDRIPRSWISDLRGGDFLTKNTPEAWEEWRMNGHYSPLRAEQVTKHRTKEEQLPTTKREWDILGTIREHWDDAPDPDRRFEYMAAALFELMDSNVGQSEITRPARDGGRDAFGAYHIGPDIGSGGDQLKVEFALEAKYYEPENSVVGVKDTSRLISRLRHRQFGVLVTTSYVSPQAYKEIKQDEHPVLIISGGDIVKILFQNGIKSEGEIDEWLDGQVPN